MIIGDNQLKNQNQKPSAQPIRFFHFEPANRLFQPSRTEGNRLPDGRYVSVAKPNLYRQCRYGCRLQPILCKVPTGSDRYPNRHFGKRLSDRGKNDNKFEDFCFTNYRNNQLELYRAEGAVSFTHTYRIDTTKYKASECLVGRHLVVSLVSFVSNTSRSNRWRQW